MLQRKSISKMQFIGEWMKAHCIANITYRFRKTIWNLVKSLKLMLTAGQAWQVAGSLPYFNINPVPQITYWWIWMPLQAESKSPLVHTLGVAQHDQHSLACYFMILPVGGTLIDLSVSMKAKLELYTDARGTLIFDNYDECSPNNHERTHRAEVGYHWLQHETTDVTASPRSDHETQN